MIHCYSVFAETKQELLLVMKSTNHVTYTHYNIVHLKDPKFLGKYVCTNRGNQDQPVTCLIRVYTVAIPSAYLCRHYSMVEQD